MSMEEKNKAGLSFIAEADRDFARALDMITPLPDRTRPAGFEPLARIIVEQQVSIASARAIWGRLTEAISPFEPDILLSLNEEELRSLGLSRQKARYCRALAEDITEGRLLLAELPQLEDAAVMEALTQVKGIGRWTAEIYMISCLGRGDIWPAGDVALQIAIHHLKDLEERPKGDKMDELAEHLRPHRTLAAQVLWRYYSDIVKPPTR